MGEFRLRAWQEQVLFDCNNYIVSADTLEEAVLKLANYQEYANNKGKVIDTPDVQLIDPITNTARQVVKPLEPEEVVSGTLSYAELDVKYRRVRDLTGDVPSGCVPMGEPLEIDWTLVGNEETITNEDDPVVEDVYDDESEIIDVSS